MNLNFRHGVILDFAHEARARRPKYKATLLSMYVTLSLAVAPVQCKADHFGKPRF